MDELEEVIPSLTYEERVACQEKIERIYWNHRIWPKENPAPKPSFESVMSRSQVKEKVNDILQKTNALEMKWGIVMSGKRATAGDEPYCAQHEKTRDIAEDIQCSG